MVIVFSNMSNLNIVRTSPDEYSIFREKDESFVATSVLEAPQAYGQDDVFVMKESTRSPPIVFKIFLGGLSIVGLFMVHRMLNRTAK
jgi:hypothetical protein